MKKIFSIVLFSFCALMAFSQEKVVEKSGKRPKWVNKTEEGYFIASAAGSTIDEAKDKALSIVRDRIVNAVAVNVQSSSQINVKEVNNNDVYNYMEEYNKTTSSTSAAQNYLKGISENKIKGFYWEKKQNKSTKKVIYDYHVKYAFSTAEVNKLVREFQKRDAEMTQQLQLILAEKDRYTSVEDMANGLAGLQPLIQYFPDQRKQQAEAASNQLSQILSSVSIEITEQKLGEASLRLVYGGKTVTTSRKPVTQSECAVVTSLAPIDDHWVLRYNPENCSDNLENNIKVIFQIGSNRPAVNLYFDVREDKVSLTLKSPVRLYEDHASLDVLSKYSGAFTVTKIILQPKGSNEIILDKIDQAFSGTGTHPMTVLYTKTVKFPETSRGDMGVTIYYKEGKNKTEQSVQLYRLQYILSE